MVRSFWKNRHLIGLLAKRDIVGRYQGSIIGIVWSLLNPIIMLLVYTFIFSIVFNARWQSGRGSKAEFALVLFSGLIIFNIFSECISRAPTLILTNVNYAKKVVFPLEILPWVSLFSAIFHMAVSLIVWMVFYIVMLGWPLLSSVLFIPIIVILVMLIMGLSWFLASLGVYFRDILQFISIVLTMLMFLSPIFYPVSAIPEKYRFLLLFNPLTPFIEQARNALFGYAPMDWTVLAVTCLVSLCIAVAGFAWFQKTRKGFADVL